jgi:hypothetical protein
MPKNVSELSADELRNLHLDIIELRQKVLDVVPWYGFSASQLVSKDFQREVELAYGCKQLKSTTESQAPKSK